MRYYIVAGEASGDLHASNLMKAIKKLDNQADFRCWGGHKMEAQGCTLVKHYKDLAFMGFWQVITNIRTIVKNLRFCQDDISGYKPDALILIDYPGFNLRIAKFARKHNIKVYYYISPQVWAWKKSRVHLIKKTVDKMLVILPFEKDFYAQFDYEVDFVGHPLLDAIAEEQEQTKSTNHSEDKPTVAILPGSRKQEIEKMLPVMLKVTARFPEYRFVVCAVSSVGSSIYDANIKNKDVQIVYDQTYDVLAEAYAALVTSGTATLETALFKVPQVVCYKADPFSYIIAKKLIKLKYISLVNLIMDQKVLTELIQKDFNEARLCNSLKKITQDKQSRQDVLDAYEALSRILGGTGASSKAASIIYQNALSTKTD